MPGHIAGIILNDGCSKIKQWFNSATNLKGTLLYATRKVFWTRKCCFSHLTHESSLGSPVIALVIQQNYLSNQREDKEWSSCSSTPSLSRHVWYLTL